MAEVEKKLSNGDTVIYFEGKRRKIEFNLDDIYKYRLVDDGSAIVRGKGTYVPMEGDRVWDWQLGFFRVARVDLTDYHVDLTFWEAPQAGSDIDLEDKLLGVGPGYTSESYRVYIDSTVFPHRLDMNSRLRAYGSGAKEVRIFMGVNVTDTGEVISQYYNANTMDYVGDAIPLEVVRTDDPNNLAIKSPRSAWTTKDVADGELVTAVVYNDQGSVTDMFKLLVQNTNVVRHPEDADKRVRAIELISPYLSSSEPNTLLVPLNVTVATLAMRAKVTYIDGSTATLDVTDETANGKFILGGLKYWSPSVSGQEQELTLFYQLSDGEEYSYLQGETANGKVKQTYKIRAKDVDYAYSLKLYAFPAWISGVQGYGLEYWLYDLTRKVARKVPKAAISLGTDGAPFDGLDYTSTQHVKFGVDLSVVDVAYGDATHAQSMQIALLRDGGVNLSNWKVKFAGNQTDWFGDGLVAKVKAGSNGLSTVNFGLGLTDQAAWLEKVYYSASPLYDIQTEPRAPAPTHFIVVTKTRTVEVLISQWKNDITFINDLTEGQTIYLKWIKRLAGGDLQLGVSGFPVHQV